MKNSSFKQTPIPQRTKSGEPMRYYVLSEDSVQTKVTRAVCLVCSEEPNNPYPQRWYVDEESGLVIRLPRNQMGEDLARDNMRSIWREEKYQERWAKRTASPSVNDDGDEIPVELADNFDIEAFLEDKALLDTLYDALAALTQVDLDLIKDIFWDGRTERQLAPELGLKEPKSVNKRKHRILEILRNNDALRDFFK